MSKEPYIQDNKGGMIIFGGAALARRCKRCYSLLPGDIGKGTKRPYYS